MRVSVEIPDFANYRFADMAWSPDSAIIGISVPNTLYLYSPTLSEPTSIRVEGIATIDWQDTGKLVVTGTNDGTITLWGVPNNPE